MIIRSSDAALKKIKNMAIKSYKINNDFSGSLITIHGNHGAIKCIGEDRIYFVLAGKGKFIIENKEETVGKNDVVFIPKNTLYNIIGKLKYFLICFPAFKPGDDVWL